MEDCTAEIANTGSKKLITLESVRTWDLHANHHSAAEIGVKNYVRDISTVDSKN